jgi:hypothetical protein
VSNKFENYSEPCKKNDDPFMILGYRDSVTFFSSDLSGMRPIYIDELESNEDLKSKILEFLTDATSQRGISASTKYGLVNGWVDSS